jgi:electron transport complex protein RnfB
MSESSQINRRNFLRMAAAVGGGGVIWQAARPAGGETVWQLDPTKCVQCGRCATECVLNPSAVKCVHSYQICGYCDLCGGYLQPGAKTRDTGAESQLCPVAAIKRTFIEDPFFQYTIDEDLCVGCGKCVKGCGLFGNGSLYLQVKHDLCVNCNECAIARSCPADAFRRVSADDPYLLKGAPKTDGAHE